tara:strand:+ start:9071 stop:9292 length:222 start_codon:yes stop_codon:yes gene_type:complete
MSKKPEINPFEYGRKFKNEKAPPSEFPVKDPAVLKGIRDSVRAADKGRAHQPRFRAWGAGLDYDAMKDAEKNG